MPAGAARPGFNFIRLATPTTDDKRLPAVLAQHVGLRLLRLDHRHHRLRRARHRQGRGKRSRASSATPSLPVCVGFGVRTAEQARAIARDADGVVVGSALVEAVRGSLDSAGSPTAATAKSVADLVRALAAGVRAAERVTASVR